MPPAPNPLRHGILATDAYQLTMAQLYFRAGLHERRVRFEHFFRSYPDYGDHQAGYCVAAGLAPFADWVISTRATPADVAAVRTHRSRIGGPLFGADFVDWLAGADFAGLHLDAVPEGRVVHPNTPITVVEGPLATAQLLETPLLNQLNFSTLIATKAARVVEASRRRPVLEIGMRRAAAEGADAASRAAIVGGAVSTSNSAVAYGLGLTPAGTHAHSMVQLFMALGGSERDAFDAYADVYPDDTVLLVDTVDTLGSG
ncbi:MAG: nicotinate phosphoribosyltransferase, partial [Actinomycetes bacterium]